MSQCQPFYKFQGRPGFSSAVVFMEGKGYNEKHEITKKKKKFCVKASFSFCPCEHNSVRASEQEQSVPTGILSLRWMISYVYTPSVPGEHALLYHSV